MTTLALACVWKFERARFMSRLWAELWERIILAFGSRAGLVWARIMMIESNKVTG